MVSGTRALLKLNELEIEGGGGTKGIEGEGGEISLMCESIGHRPLRGRCPAPPSTSTPTYLSRARVPLTI